MTAPRRLASSPFAPPAQPATRNYEVGQRVTHDAHGLGRVVSTSGTTAVTVDFGSKVCHFSLPCASLDLL